MGLGTNLFGKRKFRRSMVKHGGIGYKGTFPQYLGDLNTPKKKSHARLASFYDEFDRIDKKKKEKIRERKRSDKKERERIQQKYSDKALNNQSIFRL